MTNFSGNHFLFHFLYAIKQLSTWPTKIFKYITKNTDIDDDSIETIKNGLQYMPPISNYPC